MMMPNGYVMMIMMWSGHRAQAQGNLQTGSQAANYYDYRDYYNQYKHDIML